MKASGSYESLVRGVSQQVPQNRGPGQHTESINMVPDPVKGLARRHGSILLAEKKLTSLSVAKLADYAADTDNWITYEYANNNREFVLLVRRAARPAGSDLPVMLVYDKTNSTWLDLSRNVTDAQLDLLESGGVSAIVAIGKYVFMAGHTTATSATITDKWAAASNIGKAAVWVRGGVYSRVYEVKATKTDNSTVTFSYTTPSSSYQGTLDTSDILSSDPDYTKKVNDRVNAYNTAVTQWIGAAAAAIQPQAIAQQLKLAADAAGLTGGIISGSTLLFSNVKALTVTDGGDGTLLRGVAQEVESAERVSATHYAGKIVKVRAKNSAEAYYLRAIPADPGVADGTITEVTWSEGVGQETAITAALLYGTVDGNTMYLASSATLLNAILPGDHPDYVPSAVGDLDSSPLPYFVGGKITYLGMFQDRLVIGCGAVVLFSKVGDYLNWFRSSVLTVPDDDPLEMQAQGADDDILRHSVLYDRDLVIFGDKRQYAINGRLPLTPSAANMQVLSSHADAADLPPIAAGGLIFFGKLGSRASGVYQIEPGRITESPEAYEVSTQLNDYIEGRAIEMALMAKPTALFVRATGKRNDLFVFNYLDQQDGRRQDAWHRWRFNADLGPIIGISPRPSGLMIYTLRTDGTNVWVCADVCPLESAIADNPYLDSLRPYTTVAAGTGSVVLASTQDLYAAFPSGSTARLFGAALSDVADLLAEFPSGTGLMVGYGQAASFTPTNPFVKDRQDKPITTGRLVVSRLVVAFSDTSAIDADVTHSDTTTRYPLSSMIVGNAGAMIGRQPIVTGQVSVAIGRESREYTITFNARDWLPMTLTTLEWVGQFYHRPQRI